MTNKPVRQIQQIRIVSRWAVRKIETPCFLVLYNSFFLSCVSMFVIYSIRMIIAQPLITYIFCNWLLPQQALLISQLSLGAQILFFLFSKITRKLRVLVKSQPLIQIDGFKNGTKKNYIYSLNPGRDSGERNSLWGKFSKFFCCYYNEITAIHKNKQNIRTVG